jgi:tetratricopeptide (TPR) repeat protein
MTGKAHLIIGLMALLGAMALGGCQSEASRRVVRGNQLYVEGALAYQDGNRERAMAALQSAVQENPDHIMARFLMGTIFKEKGEYAAAAEQYKRAAELASSVAGNFYNLGLMYHLLNRLQEAAASYVHAINLNPQDLKSNMYLGLVYTALGKPQIGLPYSQRAVELDPQSGEAIANLGVVLDALADYPGAERAYRRGIELDSDRTETAINLAGNLAAQKRYHEAANVYQEILKKTDSSLLRQRYGHVLFQGGQQDSAVVQFEQALKINARNYQAMNGLGEALIAQYRRSAMLDDTKLNQAVAQWKKSLELNPQQPRIEALLKEYAGSALFP